jgi:hypothetical protein
MWYALIALVGSSLLFLMALLIAKLTHGFIKPAYAGHEPE